MKSKILLQSITSFGLGGTMEAVVLSDWTHEPICNVLIEFKNVDDEEIITYQITEKYENTEFTEGEIYAELEEHGKDQLESEIVQHYADLFEEGYSFGGGIS